MASYFAKLVLMGRLKELLIVLVAMVLAVSLFSFSQRNASAQTACDIDCLNDKIAALTRRVAALERAATGTRARTTTTARAGTRYFQISGGSATGGDWTDVTGSDFYFDQSLYDDVASVTWEGWMQNGQGQARLYDATNNRAVDGSEVSVSAVGAASFYSAPLAIWRGQNQYRIQIKNVNLQTVTIITPRLKITTR